MTNQQIIENDSLKEIPLSQRVYAFTDLPKDVREKLLRLQNTDADFLKLSSGETGRRVSLLILTTLAAIGLWAIVADASLDLKRIIAFSVDAVILFVWFVYFVWQIFKAVSSPLKNLIYLTPTQVVETLNGFVRYRELKDAKIFPKQHLSDSGRTFTLNVEFEDGDFYNYWFGNHKTNFQKRKDWGEKALTWKKEAVSAFERGDTAYLELCSVFPKLSETNTLVLQRRSYTRAENVLLIITIALIALNGCLIYFLSK